MKKSIKIAIVAALAASLSAPALALGDREKSALMGFAGALVLGHVLGGGQRQAPQPQPMYYPAQQPAPQIEVYNNMPAPQQYAPQPIQYPVPQPAPQYQQQQYAPQPVNGYGQPAYQRGAPQGVENCYQVPVFNRYNQHEGYRIICQ